MSLDINSAAAIVRFKGLGILCFNEALARAENLFIHKNDHKLLLEIYAPVSAEDNDKLIADNVKEGDKPRLRLFNDYWYEQYAAYPSFQGTDDVTPMTIEVRGIGNPDVAGYAKYTPDDFHRDILNDDVNDLRWIVDPVSDGIFPSHGLLTIGDPEAAVSRLYINNATFYTATIPGFKKGAATVDTTAINFRKVALLDDGAAEHVIFEAYQNAAPFGPIGEEIGAGIDADAVQLMVTVGTEAHTHIFPRIHMPIVIYLNNSATTTPESDIPVYRNFWGPSSEPTFNLIEEEVIKTTLDPAVDPVSGTEMCYGIVTEEPPCIEALTGGVCP